MSHRSLCMPRRRVEGITCKHCMSLWTNVSKWFRFSNCSFATNDQLINQTLSQPKITHNIYYLKTQIKFILRRVAFTVRGLWPLAIQMENCWISRFRFHGFCTYVFLNKVLWNISTMIITTKTMIKIKFWWRHFIVSELCSFKTLYWSGDIMCVPLTHFPIICFCLDYLTQVW